MYRIIRPLLFRLDPEQSHALTLQALRLAGNFAPSRKLLEWIYKSAPRPKEVFGLTFRNPLGLAAGYDKDAVAVRGLAALGFGHVEVGTITLKPQAGNPKPRVFRLIEDEAVINRMGFPSRGSAFAQKRLTFTPRPNVFKGVLYGLQPQSKEPLAQDTVLGVNIGKNKDTPNEEAVLDYLALLQNFSNIADYLTVNVSSPNTVGLRSLQGRAALEALLTQLHRQRLHEQEAHQKRLPILVKLAPDLSEAELDDALEALINAQMDGVIVTNTTLSREGLRSNHREESGGLSGNPLREKSEAILRRTLKRADGKIPIVSVGGIMTPDDAQRRLDWGAALIQIYTGLIYRGPRLAKDIQESFNVGAGA